MNFKQAFEALKQGASIKLPEWKGYWKWEDNSIKMHTKDGRVLDIRETENVAYTFSTIIREDWEMTDVVPLSDLNVITFSFGEAIRNLKNGKKVARKGWNGKGMWVVLMPALYLPPYNTQDTNHKVNDRTAIHIGKDTPLDSQPYVAMWTANQQWQPGWIANQADMLAEDWCIVE